MAGRGPHSLTPPPTADKAAWRAWARERRRDLAADAAGRTESDRRLLARLLAWPPWGRARWALVYVPFGDEAAPLDPAQGGVGWPRLATTRTPAAGGRLTIHPYDPVALERHALGFSQPLEDAPTLPFDEIDVVLVPGLLFDRRGARLGYGRGLYDRLLASAPRHAATVGVTLDALVVPELPTEPHDVAVAWLLTESGVRRAGER